MNYRHLYHAGNFADVFKHICLVILLDIFKHKDKPFFYLDTHAGSGMYALDSLAARKTNEAQNGILKIIDLPNTPPLLQNYLHIVKSFNVGKQILIYPGSPMFAQSILRKQDRLFLCELHLETYRELEKIIDKDRRCIFQLRDGYAALKALLPQAIKRGIILIDPPFEKADEFTQIVIALKEALKRFATGTYVIWYPLKQRAEVNKFYRELKKLNFSCLKIEMQIGPESENIFNACGLAIINPPYTFDTNIVPILTWLIKALAADSNAKAELEWLFKP